MARLTGCCCCFGLRNGARAIGITQTVMAFIHLVCYFVFLLPSENHLGIFFTSFSVSLAIFFNVRMVLAVNKNDPVPVYGWLIFSGVACTIWSAAVIAIFVLFCLGKIRWVWDPQPTEVWWVGMLGVAGLVGLCWYWFVVVLHCYQEMQQEAADSRCETALQSWMARFVKTSTGDASGSVKTPQPGEVLKGEPKLPPLPQP